MGCKLHRGFESRPLRWLFSSARAGALAISVRAMGITSLVLRVHERLYKQTDGRIGHGMLGVPTLLLRTTGRRSGATRTNALVYARDGEAWLVVASNGGATRPPGWRSTLRARTCAGVRQGL